MCKIYWIVIILFYIVNKKCMAKKIKCYEHGYLTTFPSNKTIIDCDKGCMEKVCYIFGSVAEECRQSEPCVMRRRGCDDGFYDSDDQCEVKYSTYYSTYMKELRKNCSYDLCNDDKLQLTKCVIKLNSQMEPSFEMCSDGCSITTCSKGYNTNTLYYGCYNESLCHHICYGQCVDPCYFKTRHGCRKPCYKDHCNDPMGNILPIPTTTDATTKTITPIGVDEIITFQHMGLRTINGWVGGKAEPFKLTKMLKEECGKGDQISRDMAMKICVQKDAKCIGGLTLCYRSQMSGVQNLEKLEIVANRTAPFRLDVYLEENNPIDQLCNQKKAWNDWQKLKKHGFNLSSNGQTVQIRTSYDQRISMAKLNANGCAVLNFEQNSNTSVEKSTIWVLKDSVSDEIDDYGEKGEETSSSVVHSSTTTTLTAADNVTSNSNTTEIAQTEQKEETSTDVEQTSSDAEIEQTDTSIDKHFWSKLRGGVPLRSFDPLVGLAFDVLTGVGHDKPELFAVKQDQKNGACQMRITFHKECVDECLSATNLDNTVVSTD